MIAFKSTSIQKQRRCQRGASLIEIMVAMLIMAIMFNGLLDMFLSSRATFSATDNLSRLQENGRTTVDLLVSSLRRSGYMGGNSDPTIIFGTLGASPNAETCAFDDDTWARMITQRTFGLDDTRAGYDCIKPRLGDAADAYPRYLGGDILTLRFASPWQVEAADMVATRAYLRSSLFRGNIFLGADSADATNIVEDLPQWQHQLLAYSYYVADTGRTCNGAVIPGLFREAPNVNNLPRAEELVEGVENIQFQYNIGDRYVDADNVGDWNDVLSVKLWVLVRSACPETGYTDGRTYVLGNITPYAPADDHRRHLYTTVVALRN
jgi:type IV pilus assembly protein PilW